MSNKPSVPKGCPLTSRQWQVMSGLARGQSPVTIAKRLGITPGAVRSHIHEANPRLGASTLAQAVAILHEAGWLDPVDTDWGDSRLTAAQHLYLRAFDLFLKARHDPEVQRYARGAMRHHLGSLCIERQIPVPDSGKRCVRRPGLEQLMAALDTV